MLARFGQILSADSTAVRRGNRRLARLSPLVPRLGPSDDGWRLAFIHFANGAFSKGHVVAQHQHEALQFEAAVSGRFCFEAQQSCTIQPGECCVIPPRHPHAWRCEQSGVLLGVLLEPDREATESADRPNAWLKRRRVHRINHPNGDALLAEVVDAAVSKRDRWVDDRLRHALALWLTRLLAASSAEGPEPENVPERSAVPGHAPPPHPWGFAAVGRAEAFIRANYARSLRLAEIAREAGLSERHLSRLFREHRGVSVQQFLQSIRLKHARELIRREPDQPMKVVALRCGFRQAAYFSRCYGEHFGCCPSAERTAQRSA